MYATIQKWGNSQGIRLPKSLLASIGLNEQDKVELVQGTDSITIRKITKKHRTLEERMAGFTGAYEFDESDWGSPVGGEVW